VSSFFPNASLQFALNIVQHLIYYIYWIKLQLWNFDWNDFR